MGQAVTSSTENRVKFDECDNNGMIISGNYIPEELISQIMLYYADEKTLLNCQRVCKRWNMFMADYVWRKKAEMKSGHKFPAEKNIHWKHYYLIYSKNLFGKNLLKNHSGEEGLEKHWEILSNSGDGWRVECPPVGVPALPAAPEFENKQHCFVTSYQNCLKQQIVDLTKEGFSPYILDEMRPPIEINEWYSCRWDCPAKYKIIVRLESDSGKELDIFTFADDLEHEKQNVWLNVKHEFRNYGKGLRKIHFIHAGRDKPFWAGHYGSKMAGAYVRAKAPSYEFSGADETDDL